MYVLHTTPGGQHDWRPPYRALHLLEYLHRQAATANVPRQSFLLMLSHSFNLARFFLELRDIAGRSFSRIFM